MNASLLFVLVAYTLRSKIVHFYHAIAFARCF